MAKIPVKQFTSWSASRYFDYKLCPLKAKFKHLDKITEPVGPPMLRGIEIHDLAAGYIRGTIAKLPADLKLYKKEFQRLRKQFKKAINGMVVEDNWAFTKNWDETRWNDWVNCWVRVKLDLAEEVSEDFMIVTDWKTGKFREEMNEDYIESLELYCLAALLMNSHIEKVKARLEYVDIGYRYPENDDMMFTRKDIPKLKKLWEKRIGPMMKDKRFAPRPNAKCCWCHYRKSNKANGGGQCKF